VTVNNTEMSYHKNCFKCIGECQLHSAARAVCVYVCVCVCCVCVCVCVCVRVCVVCARVVYVCDRVRTPVWMHFRACTCVVCCLRTHSRSRVFPRVLKIIVRARDHAHLLRCSLATTDCGLKLELKTYRVSDFGDPEVFCQKCVPKQAPSQTADTVETRRNQHATALFKDVGIVNEQVRALLTLPSRIKKIDVHCSS
jgi:hypothetical protein